MEKSKRKETFAFLKLALEAWKIGVKHIQASLETR